MHNRVSKTSAAILAMLVLLLLAASNEVFAPYSHNADAPTQTPEPATMLLFGTGLIGLPWVGRKQLQCKKDA